MTEIRKELTEIEKLKLLNTSSTVLENLVELSGKLSEGSSGGEA
jgi:hypothetical protein